MKNCNGLEKDILCDNCNKLVNQKKKFSANINEMKKQPPNKFGHMLPKCLTISM